jgi:hypothetical protein
MVSLSHVDTDLASQAQRRQHVQARDARQKMHSRECVAPWRQLGFWLSETAIEKQKPAQVLFEYFTPISSAAAVRATPPSKRDFRGMSHAVRDGGRR